MIPLSADPMLPQRDRLLNPVAAGALVERHFFRGRTRDGGAIRRVKYRVGESLRVLYTARVDGIEETVSLRAFPLGNSVGSYRRVRAALNAAERSCGTSRYVAHEADDGVVLCRYPADRKLPFLPRHATDTAMLAELLPHEELHVERCAYAPEKNATFSVHAGTSTLAYAKMHVPAVAGTAWRRHCALTRRARAAGIKVPTTIGYLRNISTIVLESAEGIRFADLDAAALRESVEAFGGAVARLHRVPAPADPFVRHRVSVLQRAVALVSAVRPELRRLATEVLARLEDAVPAPGTPVCLHGDLHHKNVLSCRGRVALIDLDQGAAGPAAADLGSYAASLRYAAIVGLVDPTEADRLIGRFLDGYGAIRPLPPEASLAWHTAAALVSERVLRAVNRVRIPGLMRLETLLLTAHGLLEARS